MTTPKAHQTIRRERLAAHLCVSCGDKPPTPNVNGAPAVRCAECKNTESLKGIPSGEDAYETKYYARLARIQDAIVPILKKLGPTHKGYSQREIAMELNEDTVLVGCALAGMHLHRHGSTPEKWRFDPPPPRTVPPEEWPVNPVMPKYIAPVHPKSWPSIFEK